MNRYSWKGMALRYSVLIILSLGNLWIFYQLFTPLTVYGVLGILKLTTQATLTGLTIIDLPKASIHLIPACIAGSAYYLLCILNLITPMEGLQRAKSLFFLMLSFLIVNIIRIVIFTALIGTSAFYAAHLFTWFAGSTIFVIGLWLFNVKFFRIRSLPFWTDATNLFMELRKPVSKKR